MGCENAFELLKDTNGETKPRNEIYCSDVCRVLFQQNFRRPSHSETSVPLISSMRQIFGALSLGGGMCRPVLQILT